MKFHDFIDSILCKIDNIFANAEFASPGIRSEALIYIK